jgi:hypothetical protein
LDATRESPGTELIRPGSWSAHSAGCIFRGRYTRRWPNPADQRPALQEACLKLTTRNRDRPILGLLSLIDGRLAIDGVPVEDDAPRGFKAPERPPIGFALKVPAGLAVH